MTGISHRYCTVLYCTVLYCTIMLCIAQNVDYSYTFELPETDETGDHGFLLPPSNIVKVGSHYVVMLSDDVLQVGKQLLAAFVTMARKLRS